MTCIKAIKRWKLEQYNGSSVKASSITIAGKTSRTTFTVYKAGDTGIVDDTSFLGQYGVLLITFAVSVVLLIILIIVVRKGGKHK